MADIQGLKEKVQREIDEIAPLLIECSDWMADNPEIGLQEYQASAKLARMLEESGAEVERGIGKMPTAFRAALAGSSSGEWHEYVKPYLSYLPNNVLGGVVRANMEALGRTVGYAEEVYGSTDFGNVSQVIPTAYALFGICGEEVGWHSREVAAATKTKRGHDALIAAAKTLAMSTLDLLGAPDLIARAKREHQAAVGSPAARTSQG